MLLIRSTLFNIAFFGWLILCCVFLAWTALLPRDRMMEWVRWVLRGVSFLERHIAGIEYEVIGLEKLPTKGSYIVAAKHQSAWETMKLHVILGDPAVVLKKELTQVPVWGLAARKSRMIPVDRSARGRAISSLLEGAAAIAVEGRPIVIFPQGTRVAPGAVEPYKAGVALMYNKLKLPMVPMALNSGVFWGRKAYFKRPGKITVQFFDPIPAGLPRDEAMARLEKVLEAESDRLVRMVGGPGLPDAAAPAQPVESAQSAESVAAKG
ncbi:MAG TPA: lysophospholipid acyltransferase family protein [Azospirillaceae bacterium]|nr:lysophospholipid acyltransferase family protein [Azospirillaceae bacterium]